jgi:ABC-type transporter Mla subunit MlaD
LFGNSCRQPEEIEHGVHKDEGNGSICSGRSSAFCGRTLSDWRSENAFSGSGTYYTDYSGISGLEVGDKVRVAGLDAGEILDLRIPSGPGEKFRVKFRVMEKLFPVIRTDSIASIQTDGLLGNKYLLISTGTKEQAPLESVLPSRNRLKWAISWQELERPSSPR